MNTPDRYSKIKSAFIQAAALAEITINPSEMEVQFVAAPHVPPSSLPAERMAVYVFMYGEQCLKVGKAGPKSTARFCSQHYATNSAPSTLARSLLKYQSDIGVGGLDDKNVGDWMRRETSRVNFLIPSAYGMFVLSLLESFVQCSLKPKFEGFSGQQA